MKEIGLNPISMLTELDTDYMHKSLKVEVEKITAISMETEVHIANRCVQFV